MTTVLATRVDVAWTAAINNETGFKVEHSINGTNWSLLTTLPAGSNAYSHTGLSPSTLHYYRVYAVNAFGASAYTSAGSSTTLPLPPGIPQNVVAKVVSADYVRLDYTYSVGDQTGFTAQRQLPAAPWLDVATLAAADRSVFFATGGLAASTSVSYRLLAFNTGGNSATSSSSIITVLPAIPAVATNARVTIVTQAHLVSWKHSGVATDGCLVEWSESADGDFYIHGEVNCAEGLYGVPTDTAKRYFFRVRAFNAGGSIATTPA